MMHKRGLKCQVILSSRLLFFFFLVIHFRGSFDFH